MARAVPNSARNDIGSEDTTFAEGAYGLCCKQNGVTYVDDFKAEIVR